MQGTHDALAACSYPRLKLSRKRGLTLVACDCDIALGVHARGTFRGTSDASIVEREEVKRSRVGILVNDRHQGLPILDLGGGVGDYVILW